jgi:hypothetical protein
VIAAKNGLYGCIAVNELIQVPLIPKLSNSNGPIQQALAPIAANVAVRMVFLFEIMDTYMLKALDFKLRT